jgi:predicted ATPase
VITKVEGRNFRCLRDISQTLRPFQVLVGPNSSGKTAFLDVIDFLGDLVSAGLSQAVSWRTENFHDMVWGRTGASFELAIEAQPPNQDQGGEHGPSTDTIRYEVGIRLDVATDQVLLEKENLYVGDAGDRRTVLTHEGRRVSFHDEIGDRDYSFDLSANSLGLASLPSDRTKFPGAVWLKDLLQEGVQMVALDDDYLGGASPPGQGQPSRNYGQYLARSVLQVFDSAPEDFAAWVKHIQTAFPDIESIKTVFRPEDRHRYLMVRYRNGIEVPSWMLSGGTLRLLALTLLAYVPGFRGVYLVEEPEIGVHPTAIETIMQSLSSVYAGQVLLTSHSPVVLGLSEPRDLLCFQRTDQGSTEIIPGDQHPMLRDWRSGVSLSDLFAAGVLS